jgi:hypothetical protein
VQVITLENIEETSSAQVTSTLRELDPSTVALQVSPSFMLEGNSTVKISGQIEPQVANENVTLQANFNGGGWTTIGIVETKTDGTFSYNWTSPAIGTIEFQASWVGNRQYNGATSAQTGLRVLPLFIVIEIAVSALGVVLVMVVFAKTRGRKQKTDTAPSQTLVPHEEPPNKPEHPPQNPLMVD